MPKTVKAVEDAQDVVEGSEGRDGGKKLTSLDGQLSEAKTSVYLPSPLQLFIEHSEVNFRELYNPRKNFSYVVSE